ncbi:class II fructose-bisphosphate aldolase [Cutibacterium avidum]|uniref:class II fructose-bisphosphate aldolase n=1 Tax=Cutibacterium avidum TaxID=33010 RepID=UPI00192BFA8A|nr:class II fructose-bisphosphate aldolase [Cutibacterium avidum]QQY15580.1 class II fructose-bisphosphate aldolase [Cutibacterium avidum]
MLVDLKYQALKCQREGTGLGAFNVIHIENTRIFIDAARRAKRPIVLQISENAVKYQGSLDPLGTATITAARECDVPVVVHLDHAENIDLIHAAVDLGFTSVMYDGSKLLDQQNRETTAQVADFCHSVGVSIEAELGEVGGKNGVHDPVARTNPADAAQFVEDTGVDLLAVAVGSSHAMTSRDAHLDNDLIRAIAEATPVPLVLHGSSGVSDQGIVEAIRAGMVKINVSTHLNKIFTNTVREVLSENPNLVDSRKWFSPAGERVSAEVERMLRLFASAPVPTTD